MGTKRNYDRTFKERAVKLSQQRDNIKDLAAELGVSPGRIYKWRAEYAEHGESSFDSIFLLRASAIRASSMALGLASVQGHGIERLSDEGKRVKELEKKLKNTELELGKPHEAGAESNLFELCPARRF